MTYTTPLSSDWGVKYLLCNVSLQWTRINKYLCPNRIVLSFIWRNKNMLLISVGYCTHSNIQLWKNHFKFLKEIVIVFFCFSNYKFNLYDSINRLFLSVLSISDLYDLLTSFICLFSVNWNFVWPLYIIYFSVLG